MTKSAMNTIRVRDVGVFVFDFEREGLLCFFLSTLCESDRACVSRSHWTLFDAQAQPHH